MNCIFKNCKKRKLIKALKLHFHMAEILQNELEQDYQFECYGDVIQLLITHQEEKIAAHLRLAQIIRHKIVKLDKPINHDKI